MTELRRLPSTLTCKCTSVAGEMRREDAVQAVKPRKAPAKRVAPKAKETVKEHVIVQGKKDNVDEQQELPIEDELGSLSSRGDLDINCFTTEPHLLL